MANETGESTASMTARSDNNAWPRVNEALHSGATLFRPSGMSRYFTKCKNDLDPNDGIGISASMVKRLEASGVLIRVGVDLYGLGKVPGPVPPEVKRIASQLPLFQ